MMMMSDSDNMKVMLTWLYLCMINSQNGTFRCPMYRMCFYWENECEWKKVISFQEFTHKVSCLYLLWCVYECIWRLKKNCFFAGKIFHCTQNRYFHFHVISWRMQSSIWLLFLHIAEEIFLYQTWKLWIIASTFYIFSLILKIVL